MRKLTFIADLFLDIVDNLSKVKNDIKFKAPDIKLMPLILLAVTALGVTIHKIIESLKSTSAPEYQQISTELIDKAVGHKATIVSHYGADRTFNRTKQQIAEGKTKHEGVDVAGRLNEPIYAPISGKVIKVNPTNSGTGGRSVTIQDPSGSMLVYMAHLSQTLVEPGQSVSEGTQVGKMGGSGHGKDNAYPVHLHIQVGYVTATGTKWVNPEDVSVIKTESTKAEIEDTVSTNVASKNNAGIRNKNPGNDTYWNNPFAIGKGAGGSGNAYHSKYESFVKGYAGNAYQLLRYISGNNKVGLPKNPTLAQVVQKWVGSLNKISQYERFSGLKRDQRIPLNKEVIYKLLLTMGYLDSSYCNPSEAREGLELAWQEFKQRNNVNIFNEQRAQSTTKYITNTRVNGIL